jgi:hypothetical protein
MQPTFLLLGLDSASVTVLHCPNLANHIPPLPFYSGTSAFFLDVSRASQSTRNNPADVSH